jgi:hypothetical protein
MSTTTAAQKAVAPSNGQKIADFLRDRKRQNEDAVIALLQGEATKAQEEQALKHVEELAGIKATRRKLAAARAEAEIPPLRFYTTAELATITDPDTDWIIHGLLAPGAITEIDGKVKRSGKTTLMLDACRHILDEENFCALPTRKVRIVYLTEQQHGSFAMAVRRANLNDRGDEFLILFRQDMGERDWPSLIQAVVAKCIEVGAELLVIDTIAKLANVRGENDPEAWNDAMTPLQDAAAEHKIAIWLARHARKSDGDVGDTGRGSSAASGEVDIILDLRRPEGNVPTSRRILESASRYTETPEKMVIEFDLITGYRYLGTDEGIAIADAAHFIQSVLGGEFGWKESEATYDDLEAAGMQHSPPIPLTNIKRGIKHLTEQGAIRQQGRGVKGHPFTFSLVEPGKAGKAELITPWTENE